MTCLPDVNVWIALTVAEHVHHAVAKQWFESSEEGQIAFCRVTQMGFLRLLTNPRVMAGQALTPDRAWNVLDALFRDRSHLLLFGAARPRDDLSGIYSASTGGREFLDGCLFVRVRLSGGIHAGYVRHGLWPP